MRRNVSERPLEPTRDGTSLRLDERPFGNSSRPGEREAGGFLPEARTMEVSMRSTDIGGVPAVPSVTDRAVLLRMDGVSAGQIVVMESLPFTVGRHPTNELRVDDDSMSRFHARIVKVDDAFMVEDLGSRNGTFVAGARVTRSKLAHDSWLQFGPRVSFRFSLTDAREERLLRKLYESSTRDALTGAYNRLHFEERLRAEIAFASRHKSEASLVLIDLDHFKRVNDTYGHPAGDAVLRTMARVCMETLRTEDVFARFGGEEFAIVLRGVSLRGAARLGERLRLAVASTPIEYEGARILVTLSAGCAALTCCSAPDFTELVAIADRRLYSAKQQGRDRIAAQG